MQWSSRRSVTTTDQEWCTQVDTVRSLQRPERRNERSPVVLLVAPRMERGREDSPISASCLAPSTIGGASRHSRRTITNSPIVICSQISAHNWTIKSSAHRLRPYPHRPGEGSEIRWVTLTYSFHRLGHAVIDATDEQPLGKASAGRSLPPLETRHCS
jgi:hypothetical protein